LQLITPDLSILIGLFAVFFKKYDILIFTMQTCHFSIGGQFLLFAG